MGVISGTQVGSLAWQDQVLPQFHHRLGLWLGFEDLISGPGAAKKKKKSEREIQGTPADGHQNNVHIITLFNLRQVNHTNFYFYLFNI